jgi:hypothetical protein
MEPEIIWKVGDQGEYGGDVVAVTRVDDLGDPSIDELRVKLPTGTEITIWQGDLGRLDHYVLQNKGMGAVGNSTLFWAGFGGYRANLQEAKRFTLEEARQAVESARGSHEFVIWDYDDLMEIVEFHVDAGKLWAMREKAK